MSESDLDYNLNEAYQKIISKGENSIKFFMDSYNSYLNLLKENKVISDNKVRMERIKSMNEETLYKNIQSREEISQEIIKSSLTTNEKISLRSQLDEVDEEIETLQNVIADNRQAISDYVESINLNKSQCSLYMMKLENFIRELFGDHITDIDTHLLNKIKSEIAEELYHFKDSSYPDEDWINPSEHEKQHFIRAIENIALRKDGKFNSIAHEELVQIYEAWKNGYDKYMNDIIEYLYNYNVITKEDSIAMKAMIKEQVDKSEFKQRFRGFTTINK